MKTMLDKDKTIKAVEETASKTVSFTVTIMKIIFILIVIYSIAIAFLISFEGGVNFNEFLINIATISVGGFWAFFLGYFGWRMGQSMEIYFFKLKNKE
jgi:hypothetical protein